jgi:hydrogenase-4 component E
MESINPILNLFSIAILISAFMLVASKRPMTYITVFRIQSALLAAVALVFSLYYLIEEGRFEGVAIIFVITVVIKVFYIPYMLRKVFSKVEYKIEKDFFLNIPILMIICCVIVIFIWFVVSKIPELSSGYSSSFLVQAASVVLIGLFFMAGRKKALGQIIGFLVIENGMFLAAMLLTSGMPMVVEFGIFFDLLTAVIIMGVFVYRINETFDHIDIDKLRKLRG